MTPLEEKVFFDLDHLVFLLKNNNSTWKQFVGQTLIRAKNEFTNGVIKSKFEIIETFFNFYGGMGCLRDELAGDLKYEAPLENLYVSTFELKKHYWRLLGKEYHENHDFETLPIGTKVRLIKDTVIYLNDKGEPTHVSISDIENSKFWVINRNSEFDVTNMPIYSITNLQGTYRRARHIALEEIR